jgi:predicted nucleotidyltransferase
MVAVTAGLNRLQELSLVLLSRFFSDRRPWPLRRLWGNPLRELAGAGLAPQPSLSLEGRLRWRLVAAELAQARRVLTAGLGGPPSASAIEASIALGPVRWDGPPRQERLQRDLIRLWEQELRRDGVGFYLHGSLATGEVTDYSDCDTFLVLDDRTVTDADALLYLRSRLVASLRTLKAFDPHQHHGHFVVSETDLSAYPEPFLPLAALRGAVTLAGAQRLRIVTRVADDYAIQQCRTVASTIAAHKQQDPRGWSGHDLKLFLSQLMLLPTLVLGAEGRFVYKRDSFALARPQFSADEWASIEWASRLREQWPSSTPYLALSRALTKLPCGHGYADYVLRRIGLDRARGLGLPGLDVAHVDAACRFAERCLVLAGSAAPVRGSRYPG